MHRFTVVFIFTIVVVLTNAATITPEDLMKFGKAKRQCDRTISFDESVITQLMEGQKIEDRNFFCYAACIVKELGMENPDGTLNLDMAISKIPDGLPNRDSIVNAAKECGTLKADDPCDTAQKMYNCLQEKNVPNLLMG